MSDAGEHVDVVDAADRRLTTTTLPVCLRRGLLHRAVAVLVTRPDGRLVLQQRSRKDAWHPGRWTVSCTGHVKSGESYRAAARRELSEELGLNAHFEPLFKKLLPKIRSGGLTEWEVVTVFACRTGLPLAIDHAELEKAEAFTRPRLEELMKRRALTPDAKIILRDYLTLASEKPGSRGTA